MLPMVSGIVGGINAILESIQPPVKLLAQLMPSPNCTVVEFFRDGDHHILEVGNILWHHPYGSALNN